METLNLSLTNAYAELPVNTSTLSFKLWTSHLNTGAVSIAKSATPWATEVVVLWPSQWTNFIWWQINVEKLYAKSSVASGDVIYILKD